jgi:hypothetical protein
MCRYILHIKTKYKNAGRHTSQESVADRLLQFLINSDFQSPASPPRQFLYLKWPEMFTITVSD